MLYKYNKEDQKTYNKCKKWLVYDLKTFKNKFKRGTPKWVKDWCRDHPRPHCPIELD
ncbi:hypothetical protein J6Z48_02410 [bacterium]|nr:hypothetical protein [bacterium]